MNRTNRSVQRVVVLGGLGSFGRTAVEKLRDAGVDALAASRRPGGAVQVDAEDRASLGEIFRRGDLVIDTAGPFQDRSIALLEAAVEIGYDVIDLNDNLEYAVRLLALEPRIDEAGVRVLTSCSSVSAIAATGVQLSGIEAPVRLTSFLVPATRHTANPGSARSLLRSVGEPVRVLRDGELVERRGWRESRRFAMPEPIGLIRGYLFESADSVLLPRVWPSLRTVEMFVDTNTFGLNSVLGVASRWPALRGLIERQVSRGSALSRLLGSSWGGLGYEVEDSSGRVCRYAVVSGKAGYVVPVAPAVLAARRLCGAHTVEDRGLVPPHRQVDPDELVRYLAQAGVEVVRM